MESVWSRGTKSGKTNRPEMLVHQGSHLLRWANRTCHANAHHQVVRRLSEKRHVGRQEFGRSEAIKSYPLLALLAAPTARCGPQIRQSGATGKCTGGYISSRFELLHSRFLESMIFILTRTYGVAIASGGADVLLKGSRTSNTVPGREPRPETITFPRKRRTRVCTMYSPRPVPLFDRSNSLPMR